MRNALVGIWLGAGCGAVDLADDYPPPDPLPAEYTACETEADCVVTELGCCDDCNGGLAVAVRADQEAAVVDLYSESCAGSFACTEIGCPPFVVSCDAGTCAAARGDFTQRRGRR